MCLNEAERRQLLYLQGYYLQSKELLKRSVEFLNYLEKKLEGLKKLKESSAETLEQEG
jgi:hypothetical protein